MQFLEQKEAKRAKKRQMQISTEANEGNEERNLGRVRLLPNRFAGPSTAGV
jgi:hypothetical protein